MAYVQKSIQSKIGKQVMLTKDIESMAGSFEAGSIVTITEVDPVRGFSFSDEHGNRVIEAGWNGFIEVQRMN